MVNIVVLGVDIVQRVNRIPLVILSVFQRILIFFDLVGYLVGNLEGDALALGVQLPRF